ncbi:hypothetical protein VC273_12695 [Xanthomonas nasturtii]|nr:hypothetical protein [Xanthomonas nasturtii]MEA9556737.1 hypothetical protein [Xanthomonas nasturtii]
MFADGTVEQPSDGGGDAEEIPLVSATFNPVANQDYLNARKSGFKVQLD